MLTRQRNNLANFKSPRMTPEEVKFANAALDRDLNLIRTFRMVRSIIKSRDCLEASDIVYDMQTLPC